jgi:ATP-binding cassette subfamily C protein LapB
MVVVTHRMSLLALADRVIVLDQGRVVADGPKDAILEAINSGKVKTG